MSIQFSFDLETKNQLVNVWNNFKFRFGSILNQKSNLNRSVWFNLNLRFILSSPILFYPLFFLSRFTDFTEWRRRVNLQISEAELLAPTKIWRTLRSRIITSSDIISSVINHLFSDHTSPLSYPLVFFSHRRCTSTSGRRCRRVRCLCPKS